MYFKQSDIQEVKKNITERSTKLNVMIGAKDEAAFEKVINSILKQKKYSEGEDIDKKHMTALKSNVNIAISNVFFSWIFGFGGKVKIQSPAPVKERYSDMLRAAVQGLD